jgi:hypothetical protein
MQGKTSTVARFVPGKWHSLLLHMLCEVYILLFAGLYIR